MAIATKTKPKTTAHKKRTAAHHRKSKAYHKSYWPYLPMLLVVMLGFAVNSFMSHPRAVLGWQQSLNQEALLLATNNDRRANQRTGLTLDSKLSEAAQTKAQDMVQKDYWSHNNPSGKQPWQFIVDANYQYLTAGENLAYGFTSADAVLNGWMHSPEHKANVLETSYSQVGFGVAESPNFQGKGAQTVIVAMYASPTTDPANISQQTSGDGWMINRTEKVASVSRVEAVAPTISGIVVGMVGTYALIAVLLRHAVAWRKLVNQGEMFIIHHPVLDTVFVAIAVSAVLLMQTSGFIR